MKTIHDLDLTDEEREIVDRECMWQMIVWSVTGFASGALIVFVAAAFTF